jgi:hypothetical protein
VRKFNPGGNVIQHNEWVKEEARNRPAAHRVLKSREIILRWLLLLYSGGVKEIDRDRLHRAFPFFLIGLISHGMRLTGLDFTKSRETGIYGELEMTLLIHCGTLFANECNWEGGLYIFSELTTEERDGLVEPSRLEGWEIVCVNKAFQMSRRPYATNLDIEVALREIDVI